MVDDSDSAAVEAAVSAAFPRALQATRPFGYRSGQALPLQFPRPTQHRHAAFTLAELLVTVGVIVIIVLLASQLLKSAATVTTLGHKRMDNDSQARQLLDRMAIDFAQMVKRSDVDYYLKSSSFATGAPTPAAGCAAACSSVYSTGVRTLLQSWLVSPFAGNDTIAFYSSVPGYYPSTVGQSPVSLVAYRINAQNKLERMGKGLLWNAVTSGPAPVVFMPIPISSAVPIAEQPPPPSACGPTPTPTATASPTPAWAEIASTGSWSDSEVIGPQVFRFEYQYLLKGQTDPVNTATTYSSILSDTPWDTRICSCPPNPTQTVPTPTPTCTPNATPTPPVVCCHTAPEGMQDVAAVVVTIAVIDPKSKVLVTDAQISTLASKLIDWGNTACTGCPSQTQWQTTPGLLSAQWRAAIEANAIGLPQPAISGIRVYERYLYLSPPTLLTP